MPRQATSQKPSSDRSAPSSGFDAKTAASCEAFAKLYAHDGDRHRHAEHARMRRGIALFPVNAAPV